MTASDTRREAVAAMVAPFAEGTQEDALRAVTLGEALDAIPASVLARLAVEPTDG